MTIVVAAPPLPFVGVSVEIRVTTVDLGAVVV